MVGIRLLVIYIGVLLYASPLSLHEESRSVFAAKNLLAVPLGGMTYI